MSRKQFFHSILPAFLLSASVGQIYAFTNFASEISAYTGVAAPKVQFAFSLGIFFLGMGAAFFGTIVERNIKLSSIVGTALFISGLCVTSVAIDHKSAFLLYFGYGFLLGLGTGTIYISPVKTMMLWFPDNKAIAAAVPIISFGLGSTFSTLLYKGFSMGSLISFKGFYDSCGVTLTGTGISAVFLRYAAFYVVPMCIAILLLRKPSEWAKKDATRKPSDNFSYASLIKNAFFIRSWTFMLLNISAGLCLIPLAKQMMASDMVGYSDKLITIIVGLSGIFNGCGRFVFAWWSDRLAIRINIMLIICAISLGMMTLSFFPVLIGLALLVINACYGAGFSVIPAILSDHYGMDNLSKIHGAVLSAWGVAGIIGNQTAMFVSKHFGGYYAVVVMLIIVYFLNALNVRALRTINQSNKKGI